LLLIPITLSSAETISENGLSEELRRQTYLGSEEFIEKHSAADKERKSIPRAQLKAVKPTLKQIFAKGGKPRWLTRLESMGGQRSLA